MYYRRRQIPDGGWGWMVCFGSFMLQILTNGVMASFGILFVDLVKYFSASQATAAWIGSIQGAFLNLSGLMTAPLLHRFGWRAVTIAGAIISGVGFGISAVAPNIYVLYLSYGILTGIGNGFMFITSIVVVQQYFSKRRALANGIAVSGSGIGCLVFGIATQYVISAIGWRYMALVDCIVTLVLGITSGLLYRPLPYEKIQLRNESLSKPPPMNPISEEQNVNKKTGEIANSYNSIASDNDDDPNQLDYGSISESYEVVHAITVRKSAPILTTVPSLIEDSRIFDFEFMEFPLANESTMSKTTKRKYKTVSQVHQFVSIIIEMFDFSLFKNPVFVLFTFAVLTFTYGFMIIYNYLPEWAMSLGASYTEASILISVLGVASIVTRLLCGWLADKIPNWRYDLTGVILTSTGILGLTSAAFLNYPSLIVYSLIMGFFMGGIFTLYPVILVDLLGREVFDKALGLVLAVRSLACLTAGPISGSVIDNVGSVQDVIIPFILTGAAQAMGGLAYFLIRCFPQSHHGYIQLKNDRSEMSEAESDHYGEEVNDDDDDDTE